MKRSEVVKFLAIEIRKECFGERYEPGDWLDLKAADKILQKLEELEMSPPPYVDMRLGDHMNFYEVQRWEEE